MQAPKDFAHKPKEQNNDFLRLNDGESVTLRLISETYHRHQVSRGNELVDTRDWTDEDFEEAKKDESYKLRDRFIWTVWHREDDKPKVFEAGNSIYGQIRNLAYDDDWGDPRSYDIRITRVGEKLETKYNVVPVPNKNPLTEEQENQSLELDIKKMIKHSKPLTELADE